MPGFELFGNAEREQVQQVMDTGVLMRMGANHVVARDADLAVRIGADLDEWFRRRRGRGRQQEGGGKREAHIAGHDRGRRPPRGGRPRGRRRRRFRRRQQPARGAGGRGRRRGHARCDAGGIRRGW